MRAGGIVLRKHLIVAAALVALTARSGAAADLPVRAPVHRTLRPIAAASWAGCYVGAEGGGAWGQSRHDTAVGSTSDAYAVRGGLAGGTVGCNHQLGRWVVGLEGDLAWTDKSGSAVEAAPFPATFTSATRESWLASVRARLGWAADRWLLYVTGGYAVAAVEARILNPSIGLDVADTKVRSGFAVGAGIETAIADNWSVRLEYLYVGLQNASYFDVPPPVVFARTGVPLSDNIVRAGLNYRFGAPVISKY
jgi:outer membrane immunogenic protein